MLKLLGLTVDLGQGCINRLLAGKSENIMLVHQIFTMERVFPFEVQPLSTKMHWSWKVSMRNRSLEISTWKLEVLLHDSVGSSLWLLSIKREHAYIHPDVPKLCVVCSSDAIIMYVGSQ